MVVRAGTEGFQSEQGPWSYLGAKALRGSGKAAPYVPDFDAVTAGSCRLLRVTADAYAAALRMGRAAEGRAADQIVGVRAVKQARQAPACPAGRQGFNISDLTANLSLPCCVIPIFVQLPPRGVQPTRPWARAPSSGHVMGHPPSPAVFCHHMHSCSRQPEISTISNPASCGWACLTCGLAGF